MQPPGTTYPHKNRLKNLNPPNCCSSDTTLYNLMFLGAAERMPISTALHLICRQSNKSILKHYESPAVSFHLMSFSFHLSFLSALILLPFSKPTIFDLFSATLTLIPTFNPLHPPLSSSFPKAPYLFYKCPPYGYRASGPEGTVFRITPQSNRGADGARPGRV